MKTALITTTINVPTVLSLYRKLDPDVRFFVAFDKKTPPGAANFCTSLGNAYSCYDQCSPVWRCSALIGWNTIARRNIAMLEALKWGADVIYVIDDDNIPINGYGEHFRKLWYHPPGFGERWYPHREDTVGALFFNGIQATSLTGWFDVGTLLDPIAPHRGFPHDKVAPSIFQPVTDARVGVAAGICLGDPDISAVTRIARQPVVHHVSELLNAGIVVDPCTTRTVFNSQNTAIIRELAPAFFMVPAFGRYDDIFASLVTQRVMRERGYCVHFGKPFVWQQRNVHDLLRDLRAEQYGAERILEFADWLDAFKFVDSTIKVAVTDLMRIMFTNLPDFIPRQVQELVLAWCDDCDKVMV